MSNFIKYSLFVLTIIATTSCANYDKPTIKPSKEFITRTFDVTDFDAINTKVIANIVYIQSESEKPTVEISGPKNIVEFIDVEVKGETLFFLPKKREIKYNNKYIKISISNKDLTKLSFNSVGNIVMKGEINNDHFTLNNNGTGNITIENMKSKVFNINSKGVSNINIKGSAEKAYLKTKGLGNINAKDFKVKDLKAFAQGIGNIDCRATESITAKTQGIGKISYYGDPKSKSLTKEGIGSIEAK